MIRNVYYPDDNKEYKSSNCTNAIYLIYDYLIDMRLGLSSDSVLEIKILLTSLIRDALILHTITFKPSLNTMDHLIEEIIREMIKITRYYDSFVSKSIDVRKKEKDTVSIRFYNGGEENYNQTLKIILHQSNEEILANLLEVLDSESKNYTEDSSCPFCNMLRSLIFSTVEDLNKILAKSSFCSVLPLPTNTSSLMIYTTKPSKNIRDVARECVLRGVIGYIAKYIPDEWRYIEKWNWLLDK